MELKELDTPALFVDLEIMMDNIRAMHEHLKKHGIKCRPHIKTHKVPAIAHIQMREGAIGITCQKIGEAEVMIAAGINDVLIAFNIVGKQKLERLVRLAKQAEISVVADSEEVIRGLSEAVQSENIHLKVLVECDIPQRRSGVRTPQRAAELAKIIEATPALEYEGLLAFKGGYPDVEYVKHTGEFFEEIINLLNKAGIQTKVVSSGGTVYAWTAWPKYAPSVSAANECRPGAYVFYDRMKVDEGVATFDKCAARILATIVSKPAKGRAILDAGAKTLGRIKGLLGHDLGSFGHIVEYPEAVLGYVFEEHGVVDNCPNDISIGEKITIIPNDIMDNINFHDTLYGIRKGKVETIWPIAARGKTQ